MYFNLYGMTTDQIIINRLFPAEDGYFSRWATMQAAYAKDISDYFQPVPVTQLPLFAQEVLGQDRLSEVAQTLYKDEDPMQCYINAPTYAFTKEGNGYYLEIKLPFVEKREIDLTRQSEDLVIRIGGFKRHVPLPRAVARLKTGKANMDGNRLVVSFVEEVTT
jgi:arsenite/tail-anchored protein-transporting ATPase